MSSAKVAAGCVLVAMSLTACGSTAKPEAGSPQAATTSAKQTNDPRKKAVACLGSEHVPYRRLVLGGLPALQIGPDRPAGPTAVYQATAGAAQNAQIQGRAQGAEVIGSALLYDNQASNALLNKVDTCLTKGVSG